MPQLLPRLPFRLFLTVLLIAAGAWPQAQSGAQQTPPATAAPASPAAPAQQPIPPNAPEMSTKDAPALFKARVNLVLVPVIVRDNKGKTIGTLTKENFQLFDRGKVQEITKFSVEKSGDLAAKAAKTLDTIPNADDPGTPPPDIPERFITYLFDDVHLQFGDLARARDAASRQIATLKNTERAAIYTTSGQLHEDFTSDTEKLQQTLLRLSPRPLTGSGIMQCPDMNYYMADMIGNHNDTTAMTLAIDETQGCSPGLNTDQAQAYIRGVATQILSAGRHETQVTLILLMDVVKRMSVMPGQRIVVLVSPGFITPEDQERKSEVIDRAIKSSVVINSLDARGLWTDPTFDASAHDQYNTLAYASLKRQYDRATASAQADVLAEVAYGTGGSFFQNNNDLNEGMRRLTVAPEVYYLLGFSPQNMKLDGAFHSIKVAMKPSAGGFDIQARKGYYSPRKLSNAQEQATEEIQEALFSREELSEFPAELHTQFFKASDKDATISVLCRMDAHHIQFHKADGRNINQIVIVSALFDRDGNFVSALQKTVDMKLKDETLAKLLATGAMTVKTSFSVVPGTYMIRLVVRDSEGQQLSALNGAVTIQ